MRESENMVFTMPKFNRQGHYDSLTLAGLMVVVDVCARVLAALLYTLLPYHPPPHNALPIYNSTHTWGWPHRGQLCS